TNVMIMPTMRPRVVSSGRLRSSIISFDRLAATFGIGLRSEEFLIPAWLLCPKGRSSCYAERQHENGWGDLAGIHRPVEVRSYCMPARTKKQQMAAGAALAAKRGKRSKSSLKGASRQMVSSMSEKQLEDFAKTKRKNLPRRSSKKRR